MEIKVLNIDDNKSQNLKVSDSLTKLKVNERLLKYVVDWQINHLKRKIYAQKGTGGARHASRKAPLFVGGGVAHGPKGDNYKIKRINKKIKKLALAQTISKKNTNKELYIFDDIKKEIKKTKTFFKFLSKNKIVNVLIVSDKETQKNISRSVKNIPNVKLISENGANVYDLIKYKNVLFTTSSIKNLQKRLVNEEN